MTTILYPSAVINPESEFTFDIADTGPIADPETRTFTVHWIIPERLSYLEGHFPGVPTVPGVATIDLTVEAIRRSLGLPAVRLRKLQSAKFTQPLRPGQKIEIVLENRASEPEQWKAEWKTDAGGPEAVSVAELALSLSG